MTQEIAIGWNVRVELGQHWSNRTCAWCRGAGVRKDLSRCECVQWRAHHTTEGPVHCIKRMGPREAIIYLGDRMLYLEPGQEFKITRLSG